ncbi:hypothetical protein NL676_001457 [Syzygium grande]|nr:hypothetical protein NL676_001457 [Syzygium grande]
MTERVAGSAMDGHASCREDGGVARPWKVSLDVASTSVDGGGGYGQAKINALKARRKEGPCNSKSLLTGENG